MNYFLDSNVILSYIFTLDDNHYFANNFLATDNYFFHSKHVNDEVEDVFRNNNYLYQLFLLKLSRHINRFNDYDLINEWSIHKMIDTLKPIGKLKHHDMHKVLDKIWEEMDFNENHDSFDVKLKFGIFKNDFLSSNNLRKDYIFNESVQVPNHTKKDKNILDLIKKENLRDNLLHDKDEDILFDANEFCKNNPDLDLKFVSSDQDFLKAIDILMDELCIKESINLIEFSNN